MAVTVHRHGVYYVWTQDLPDALRSQLRLGDRLWNELVSSYEQFEQDKAAVWSSYPAIAAVEERIAALDEQAATLAAKVSEEKTRQRTTRPKHPAVAQLKEVQQQVRAARQERREAISAVREDAKPRLDEAIVERRAREKAMYAEFVRLGGYWASYNDLTRRRFTVAVQRLTTARAEGRPSQLRRRRSDGTGSITVQLQRGTDDPQRSPDAIADPGGKYRNVLHVPNYVPPDEWEAWTRAERRVAGRQVIRMRAGNDPETSEPVWLEVPVQIHRQLPPEADITEARLTVRRVGPDLRAAITVVARVPDPEIRTEGPDFAIHLGWLDTGEGVQVAHWRSTEAMPAPPARFRKVFKLDPGGETGSIVIPANVPDRLARIDKTRGDRDDYLNALKARLVHIINEHGALPSPYTGEDGYEEITAVIVQRWRSPARFTALSRHLDADPAWQHSEAARVLSEWREWDRRRWAAQEHGRAKVLAHRDDLMRNVAAIISRAIGKLVIDDMSVAELARSDRDDTDLPEETRRAIARRRTTAAPGRLREAIVAACTRDGVPVVTVSAKNLSREHSCGHVNPVITKRPTICEGCGRSYDPDASATLLMLRRAQEAHEESPTEETSPPQD